jgi:hypothetical protein
MEKFRVKYSGANSLIEFYGDHRAENYPNVSKLLADALGAMPQKHPVFSTETMIATDRYFSYWSYKNGTYEIDDDIWGCSITAPDGSLNVIADLEYALTNSGHFVSMD